MRGKGKQFEKGHAKVGGRAKAMPNKATVERGRLDAVLVELGFDPIERMARIAMGGKLPSGEEIPLKLAAEATFRIVDKIVPSLKAVEHSGAVDLGGDIYQAIIAARQQHMKDRGNGGSGSN